MRMEQYIRAIAGTFVLASLALGYWVSPWFFLFTAFVGANLLQSAFTRWCLMEDILNALGIAKKAGACGRADDQAASGAKGAA
jgi:Inner membrane protein YgaP-like, transmembrane domain